ncbi:hypothetical protein BU15DRAFT_84233 [Melanogaster broomeanus]|nr:hypothetical protein BU15DRAFT_84233 [Melanogaster broomeanus]
MFTCTTCNQQFDNKSFYISHNKKCAATSSFIPPNSSGLSVTLTRNEAGVFLCYCSNQDCPKASGYLTIDAIKAHMKKLKSSWVGVDSKNYGTISTVPAQDVDELCIEGQNPRSIIPMVPAQDVVALYTKDTQSLVTASGTVINLQTDIRVDETMLSPPPPSVGSNNNMMISPRFQIPPDISMLSPPPVSPQSQSLTSVTQQQEPAQVPSLPSIEVPSISQYPKQPDLQTNITIHNGLVHHSYLDTLNLYVNEEFRFLIWLGLGLGLGLG